MKLSQHVLIGLKRLGNESLVTEDCFNALIEGGSILLVGQPGKPPNLHELSTSKRDILKESFASLLILLVESTRSSLETNTVITTIENYNLNSARLKRIADLYETYRSYFQLSLRRICILKPQITDVKWRLDFCIKSSSLQHESRAVYLIEIVTETTERKCFVTDVINVKKYRFTCSVQQLQDVVGKLRDATRLIVSAVNTK